MLRNDKCPFYPNEVIFSKVNRKFNFRFIEIGEIFWNDKFSRLINERYLSYRYPGMFIFIISTSSWHGVISISSSVRNDETNSFSFFTSSRNCYMRSYYFPRPGKIASRIFSLSSSLSSRFKRIANYSCIESLSR